MEKKQEKGEPGKVENSNCFTAALGIRIFGDGFSLMGPALFVKNGA